MHLITVLLAIGLSLETAMKAAKPDRYMGQWQLNKMLLETLLPLHAAKKNLGQRRCTALVAKK